jgi:hypothetical protein
MADIALVDVFVELADTLVDEFDVAEFLDGLTERCVRVLGIAAAGLLLTEEKSPPQVAAASSERARLLELFQVEVAQGPGLDCFRTGQRVCVPDIPAAGRWPRFTAAAAAVGFAGVHAVPMRRRHQIVGALSFYTVEPGAVDEASVRVGQAMADMATIGLLQQRAIRRRETVAAQLRQALPSRILIEQAKGVMAERLQISVDEAFALLRRQARSQSRRLTDVAYAVVAGIEP